MADDDKSKEQETEKPEAKAEENTDTGSQDKATPEDAEKWKAMARKHEKEAKAAAKKLQEIEEAGKSETQKAADRAATAEKERDAALAKALRYEVAAAKSVPPDLVQFLSASTQEDLETQADALLKATSSGKGKPANKPQENLRGGSEPNEDPEEMDPRKLADAVPRY